MDTDDGSIVIPEEEVPLAAKPTVKVKKTTKRTTKKSKMKTKAEYFAESYKEYVLSPQELKAARPQTYAYIASAVEKITDARTAVIKAAYMKAYWS